MNAATELVTKAMVNDLGDAISSQVRDYADGQSFDAQNPSAMRRAMNWIVEHDRMLAYALSEDGYEAICDLAADIEQELVGGKEGDR